MCTECAAKVYAHGLCQACYQRSRRRAGLGQTKKGSIAWRRTERGFFISTARNHFGSSRKWQAIRRLWLSQNKLSTYFGLPLVPGSGNGMSLDHITPKSRGGSNKLENLQWVTREENNLKNNMTDPEFRVYLKTVLYPQLRKRLRTL